MEKIFFSADHKKRIQTGQKIHTIRRDEANFLKPGSTINFFIEGQDKAFAQKSILATPSIKMECCNDFGGICIEIDGRKLAISEKMQLATNDGFLFFAEFYWFFKKYIPENGLYIGKIIHWTDHKY
jgi:uncharacterized protein YqfB (UPF0267 family)